MKSAQRSIQRSVRPVVARLLTSLALLAVVSLFAAEDLPEGITFERDVRPILKVACFHCHGEAGEKKGGLDVRLVRLMKHGGESGSAIVPGQPEQSLLWRQVISDEMPRGENKLSSSEKAIIRRWLFQGAQTARPEPADPDEVRFTQEERGHWAFQPIRKPPLPPFEGPLVKTPLDAFIGARLQEAGFTFSPIADRRTLIRRLTFDLTGLPPSSIEIESFLSDPNPDAYARLVDRLLASPQFGVRWGRHWLDVAGYAETDGGVTSDPKRPHAWRYRDYVIDALNHNKPVDQFLVEQLAGDELISDPLDPMKARQVELLTATGFMRMAPDLTQTSNTLDDRNAAAADAIQVISSGVIGLTVGCAQCHDHKYDPIGIDDYYQFRAIFDPLYPLENWQTPSARLVDMTPEDVKREAARIEAQAKVLEDAWKARRNAHAKKIQDLKLADVPEDIRDETRVAVLTEPAKRSEQQKALLDRYPMVKPIGHIIGLLVEYDMPAYRRFEKEQQAFAAIRATKPPLVRIMAGTERPGVVPTSRVFFRGNPEAHGDIVQPKELTVLSPPDRDIELPDNEAGRASTGRRLAYARHLTNGRHPLTARVYVNRIWQHHFGQGLVASSNDFGLNGARPTHPDLLDWLASDFMNYGWDQKRLHRLILLSRAYQQVATRRPDLDAVDPENALLGRANLRRLEAEEVRDGILFVTGRLNDRLGGPSVPVTQSGEGKAVIGVHKIRDGLPVGVDDNHADVFRRSSYIELQRSLPLNTLATFDLPDLTPNCDQRRLTTVATQALWFLNDSQMVDRGRDLAEDLKRQHPSVKQQVDELFMRLFGRLPREEEQIECVAFLERQASFLSQQEQPSTETAESSPDLQAMAILSQTLMASNRFLYVD